MIDSDTTETQLDGQPAPAGARAVAVVGLAPNLAHDGMRIVSRIPPERKTEIVQSALERIVSGDKLPEIAADYGIATITLRVWLAALGDEYREARTAWVDARLARAEEEMERADNQVSQTRARELLRYAQWQAERRDPARYGQRQQIDVRTESLADVLLRVSRED